MVPMVVSGVFSTSRSAYPQLVLKALEADVYLAIVIGRVEAAAISSAQSQRRPKRPCSYDLGCALLRCLGASVVRIEITALHEGTYYAEVHLRDREGRVSVLDSRPSDAVAIGVRMGAPIFVAPDVLDQAGYVQPEEDPADDGEGVDGDQLSEVEGVPEQLLVEAEPVDPLDRLRERLAQAVAEERYEEAAALRDEIASLLRGRREH